METMLKKYVRNETGHRIGLVVALGEGKVGWSSMNKKDKWNNEKGVMIAVNRANNGFNAKVPSWMQNELDNMLNRSKRYFNPAQFSRKAIEGSSSVLKAEYEIK